MLSRRNFILRSACLTSALALGDYAGAAPALPAFSENTERFWKKIREQFPLSPKKIFLNNGTMGVSPYTVINTMQDDLLELETLAIHGEGKKEAISALARFLNTKESELTLTHNVTEGINIVCWGLPLKNEDEVIITDNEHAGHASPWLNRMKLTGIKLVVVSLGDTAEETLHHITRAITPKTKLISIPHIPCTIGQVLPVKEICDLAKKKNILTFLDGAHPPGMIAVDLKDIGCDFYSGCCHKWILGPKGTGFLYISEEQRDTVQAFYSGAGVDTGWELLGTTQVFKGYIATGDRYSYGTQNTSLYKGIVKAIGFQEAIGSALIEQRVKALADYLQDNLNALSKKIEMLTPTEPVSKAAQVSFRVKGKDTANLQAQCLKQGIITRFVPENNINCLRVSTHIYNTYDELDLLLEEVDKFLIT